MSAARVVRARAALAAVVLAAAVLAGVAAAVPVTAAASGPPRTERRFAPGGVPGMTWWVSPESRVALQREPAPGAPRTAGAHLYTEDGFPEVDIVTREALTAAGVRWLHILAPAKPHAIAGWVPARFMTPLTQVHTRLVVDRAAERATLYRDGRPVWRARVGVGKASTPTPPGRYWIREKFPVSGDGLYGTRAFGTSDYSPYETDWPEGGIVGIHGTDEPQLIPGRPSHGCIRVRNRDIERLYRLMPVGTPLVIR